MVIHVLQLDFKKLAHGPLFPKHGRPTHDLATNVDFSFPKPNSPKLKALIACLL